MKKILIIEDNIVMRNLLGKISSYIKNLEYKSVSDGVKGIEEFKNYKPDLVLSDITLPNKTGVDLATEIRNLDKTVPIIFCSAWINEKIINDTKDLNIFSYISKPFNFHDITSIIKKALNLS